MPYFVYAIRRTRDSAERCLDDCFCTGEVMECELWQGGVHFNSSTKLWEIKLKA